MVFSFDPLADFSGCVFVGEFGNGIDNFVYLQNLIILQNSVHIEEFNLDEIPIKF